MVFQSIRCRWAQPEQAAEATIVQQQMQCHLQIQHQFGEPFEAQQIGAAFVGMTAMAEALQLPLLAGRRPRNARRGGIASTVDNQAPAELSDPETTLADA